jgi:hypothetical protein
MRCANCHREESSVKLRDLPIGMFYCDVCLEFEEASRKFRLNTDPAQSDRLYDRIGEISEKIEKLVREARGQTTDR